MKAADDIITRYQSIRDYGRVMQKYARDGAWEDLIHMQARYVCEMEQLMLVDNDAELEDDARESKLALLVEIREAEDDVRTRLDDRLQQLSRFMMSSRAQRRVQNAYDGSVVN
ncbi:MAG: flagellar protein FliT [Salinisphaera sp.]|nr:flagellar protein FliT [Salinisphaera sp.]